MRKVITFLFVSSLLLLSSCDLEHLADPETRRQEEILKLAYSMDYLYPEGFYTEADSGAVYYENTVSIQPVSERDFVWTELHTTQASQAREWSERSNRYSSVNREIIAESETEKYFEYTRRNVVRENDLVLSRIHKSDYFIPSLDKFKQNGNIGTYQGELTADKVKELVEYLFVNYSTGVYYTKILDARTTETAHSFIHTIRAIKIVYGDWGLHDQIYVNDHHFTLDKSTRQLSVHNEEIEKIQGNYNGY